MKKTMAAVLYLVLALSLVGCGAMSAGNGTPAAGGAELPNGGEAVDAAETQNAVTKSNGTAQEAIVLKEPPALSVVYGENNSIEALQGTSSWMYANEDGTWTGIEADSMHPLDAKEYMPCLELSPVAASSRSRLSVRMQWDTSPDKVTVRCWSDACWGQYDAESEELTVRTLMVDSNTEAAPVISVELKDGSYVYEVIAEWSSVETYHGKACYSFYTVKQAPE